MPHLHHGAVGSSGTIWLNIVIVLIALTYVRGWLRYRRVSPDVASPWRACSFLGGLLLIWIAVASPLAMLDHELLTVHMLQHLLLMTLAPPLIWLGEPLRPLSYGLPKRFSRAISWLFRQPIARRFGRLITEPAVCWLAAFVALAAWHVPAFFMLGLQSEAWHLIEHASFLVAGLLFWWPVIQPWPSISRWPELSVILYLFFATLPCDILSGFLVFCERVVYPVYFSSSQLFGLSALEDQQCAGALMWTCITIIYLVVGAILTMRLLSENHRARLAQSEIMGTPMQPRGSQTVEIA